MRKLLKSHLRTLAGCGILAATALAVQLLTACEKAATEPDDTDPNAQIVIQSPKGGEKFKVGQTVKIAWSVKGKGLTEVDAVNIEVSPDSGKTWMTLLTRSIGVNDPAWGNYSWTVPVSLEKLGVTYPLAANCKVKIMQYGTGDPNKIAVLKSTFAVSP
jgi:hypothetical protein